MMRAPIGSSTGYGKAQSNRRSFGSWTTALVALLVATMGSLGSHAVTKVTKMFRRGDANGSIVSDGGVIGATPNANYATAGYIAVNAASGGHALIRFENVFGNGPNQIPYGSIITSATVDLYLSGVASGAAAMHRLLVPWQDTATVQDWARGAPVYGWAVWRNNSVNMNVTLSDNSVAPRRPRLSVTYSPPW
jgi:hypothetical protein